MWLCFIVISVVTDGGTFPVEVYLVNNSSKTPVTKVELITNEQNESWSLFSFVQICFTNQQPAAGASFSHLWAAAAPDACRPGFPPHTPTDAAGGHRCSVLSAGVTGGQSQPVLRTHRPDPTGDSPLCVCFLIGVLGTHANDRTKSHTRKHSREK